MKKILHIGSKIAKSGGNPTTIDTLSKLLRSEGYQVNTYSEKRSKLLRFLEMIYKTFLLRKKTDMVIIDTYSTLNFYYAVYVAKLCRLLNITYIPILHGGDLPKRLKNNPNMSKKLFHGAMVNVSPSKYLLDQFIRSGIKSISHIPNTIEIANYQFKSRKEIEPKILWVRSFSEIYNPMLALKILESLNEKGIVAELCMVGPEKDGTLTRCKEYAKKNGLPVSFTGKLSKREWIKLSRDYDIFINTTNFDNMPVSVIEAMALGLPVISTNVGGMPYLIEHDKTGILVPPNDEAIFVDAILKLMTYPEKASSLTIEARKQVEQYDWEIVKHKWFELLDK